MSSVHGRGEGIEHEGGMSETVRATSPDRSVADSRREAKSPPSVHKAVPPAPMPRDKRGWRVAPAPDGRGTPEQHKPVPPHRLRGFWIFVGAAGSELALGARLSAARAVRKVSIIPRGMALGVTLSTPDSDRVSYSREDLEVALGGRVAEEVGFGKITTGAESDIQQLTQIARQMVGSREMSEKIGPIAVLPSDAVGPLWPGVSETSEETQRLIDHEVRRVVDDAHAQVTQLLGDHREQLEGLTHALLEAETLDAADAFAAVRVAMRTAELEPDASAHAQLV
jgi:hypothetical protein